MAFSLRLVDGVRFAPISDKKAREPRRDRGGVCVGGAKSVAMVWEVPLLTRVIERDCDIAGDGGFMEPFSRSPPTSKNEIFFFGLVSVEGDGDGKGMSLPER